MNATSDRVLSIALLDVGQGDATIILPPEGEGDPVVFDCGRDGWEVAQQLETWKVQRLEAVIASHLDLDHVGGMLTVLDAYRGRVGAVYFSSDRDLTDEHGDAKTAKKLADGVIHGDRHGHWQLRAVHRDDRAVSGGADWSITVIAPRGYVGQQVERTGAWEEPNRYSAVVRVRMAGRTILLGGDAPLLTWSELPSGELESDVFRIPHHGGALDDGGVPDGWSPERLYDDVHPDVAIVSVGTNNNPQHPDSAHWMRPLVGRAGCRLVCTQVTGRCHAPFEREEPDRANAIQEARERWLPELHNGSSHWSEPPWRHYRQNGTLVRRAARPEVPCAGTITVRIDDRGRMHVDPGEEHISFSARIGRWTTPLCRRRDG